MEEIWTWIPSDSSCCVFSPLVITLIPCNHGSNGFWILWALLAHQRMYGQSWTPETRAKANGFPGPSFLLQSGIQKSDHDFPSGPVGDTLNCQCRGTGLISGELRSHMLHSVAKRPNTNKIYIYTFYEYICINWEETFVTHIIFNN